MKKIKMTYSIFFLTMLLVPLFMTVAGVKLSASIDEHKPKVDRPVYDNNIFKYIKKFYNYYRNDYFARELAIYIYNSIVFDITGDSPVPEKVLLGKDYFLFNSAKNDGNSIADYQGYIELTNEQLESIYIWIHSFKEWLNAQGIMFYMVIPPDKHTIYYDKLPDTIKQVNKTTADQIVEYLVARNIPIIDLRPVLLKEKHNGHDVYFKTDTHWNKLGAYVGYKAILYELSKKFKGLEPVKLNINAINYTKPESKGDLLRMMAIHHFPHYYDVVLHYPEYYNIEYPEGKEPLPKVIATRMHSNNLPRLLMYRDSFGTLLQPLLSNNFSEAYFLWDYIFLEKKIDTKMIKKIKPDVVIIEFVERYLKYFNDIKID